MLKIVTYLWIIFLIINIAISVESDIANFNFLKPFKYVFLLLILTSNLYLVFKKRAAIKKNIYNILIFATFILMFFWGTLFSADMLESSFRGIYSIIILFILYSSIALYGAKYWLKIFLSFLFISGIFIIILSDYYSVVHPTIVFEMGNFKSIFNNANYFGALTALFILPSFLYKISICTNKSYKLIILFFIINLSTLLVLSRSRSALLSFVIITCIFVYYRYAKWTKNITKNIFYSVTGLLIIGFTASNYGYIKQAEQLFTNKYEFQTNASTFSTRSALWNERIDGIKARPIVGWGYGINSRNYLSMAIEDKTEKGNSILALLEEFGIFLGTFIIFTISIISISFFRKKRLTSNNYLYLIPLSIIIASLVHVNFESWLFYLGNINAIFFWFMFIALINYPPKKYIDNDIKEHHDTQSN